jgi:hypothetical protein
VTDPRFRALCGQYQLRRVILEADCGSNWDFTRVRRNRRREGGPRAWCCFDDDMAAAAAICVDFLELPGSDLDLPAEHDLRPAQRRRDYAPRPGRESHRPVELGFGFQPQVPALARDLGPIVL